MTEDDRGWMGPLPATTGCDCHVCRPEDDYDEQDRRAIDTVLRHGWQVMLVSADATCTHPDHDHPSAEEHGDPGPAFAYTIGLQHRTGHPELLMSGLDHAVMHHALNEVAQRVMGGLRLAPGDALEDVLAGVPVAVAAVADAALEATVSWAGWFHRRTPDALVLVWPDRGGVFAWQPGAPAILDDLQPPGWRVPLTHTGGLAVDPDWDFPVPPDHSAFSCSHVVDDGEAILWAARQRDDERGEDWTVHCGAAHDLAEARLVHLAHLVRSAPSLRRLHELGLEEEAWRDHPDAPWERAALPS